MTDTCQRMLDALFVPWYAELPWVLASMAAGYALRLMVEAPRAGERPQ